MIPQRKREKCTHAALANADIERARGGDFREAAECFVDAFFVNGKSNIDNREIGSLERAQTSDLSKRYSSAKKGAMFIVRDDETCDLLACAGVEYRRYLGDYDYENVPNDVDRFSLGSAITVPIIANLATSRKARGKGYAKALVRESRRRRTRRRYRWSANKPSSREHIVFIYMYLCSARYFFEMMLRESCFEKRKNS